MLELQQILSLRYVKRAGEDWTLVQLVVNSWNSNGIDSDWNVEPDLNLGMKWTDF